MYSTLLCQIILKQNLKIDKIDKTCKTNFFKKVANQILKSKNN